jgi:hypothetical protein
MAGNKSHGIFSVRFFEMTSERFQAPILLSDALCQLADNINQVVWFYTNFLIITIQMDSAVFRLPN